MFPLVILASCASLSVQGQQWNQFRGPGGRGVASSDDGLPTEFGPEKNMIWQCKLDAGHSSPCIWGDHMFLTTFVGKKLETVCVNRATGVVTWRRSVTVDALERHHRINNPASSTPTTPASTT